MGRRLHRNLKSEQLESRRPLAADLAALDVNDDMSVTSLDALIIINELNQGSVVRTTAAEAEAQLDYDVNDDGIVTPLDVLNVVNQINTGVVAVPSVVAAVVVVDPTDDSNVDTPPTDDSGDDTVDETPVDETPVDETPVDETPVDDTPVDDTPVDETPVDETPVDETPVDETPVDETPVDETPVDETPVDETPVDETPVDETPVDDPNEDDGDDDTGDDHCGRGHGRDRSGLAGRHGRGDIFDDLDANDDGALSSDEVPKALWDRLSAADADGSGSVTAAELQAYREAQRVAAVEAFFEQLDKDGSSAITSSDVSRLTWRFLSRADANEDGAITVDELLAFPIPGRWGR